MKFDKKTTAIQKPVKIKPKKRENFNQNKPKNKQPAGLQKSANPEKKAQTSGKNARLATLFIWQR